MKLTQPDRRSCGAASLIMARRLADPVYAARTRDQVLFAREVTRLHRRLTSLVDSAGGWQVPWLRTIGTPPWAVARELRLATGADYSIHTAHAPGAAWPHLQRASPQQPVAVYIGDRLCPRHVVLVVEVVDDGVWTYEPSSGVVMLLSRPRWHDGPLRVAGWDQPWLVVAPDGDPMSSA